MKVALDLQPCCGQRSGIGNYTFELVSRLQNTQDLEFQGNVFSFMGRENTAVLSQIPAKLSTCKLMPYGVYRRIWQTLPLSYGQLFPEADVTHFFDFIVPPKIAGGVIDTVHDLSHLRYPETLNERNLRRLQGGLDRSLDRSDRIIAVSKFTKGEIVAELGVAPQRIDVVYPAAVLGTAGDLTPLHLQRKWGINKGYILYVGNLEPRKNLLRLLGAYQRLCREMETPPNLILCGGAAWKSEEILKTAQELPTGHVVVTGYVTAEEKQLLLENAAAFVFPSLYEGFGMPVLEAMTCGIPVVCSSAGSLPEVTGDCARLVNPMDETDIMSGLYELITNRTLAENLSRRGQSRAKRFSWEESTERLKQIYREVGDQS